MRTGISVGDAMTTAPVSVKPDTSIAECAKMMAEHKVGSVLITTRKKVAGIMSDQDIVRKVIAAGKDPRRCLVSRYMESNVTTIDPGCDIFDALLHMRDLNIKHLPVIASGEMVGLITQKDILKIQPSLFEMLVDKIMLREMERKPIFSMGTEGICATCGFYSKQMSDIEGNLYCPKCRDEVVL